MKDYWTFILVGLLLAFLGGFILSSNLPNSMGSLFGYAEEYSL